MVSSATPGSGKAGGGHICSIKNDIRSLLCDSTVGGSYKKTTEMNRKKTDLDLDIGIYIDSQYGGAIKVSLCQSGTRKQMSSLLSTPFVCCLEINCIAGVWKVRYEFRFPILDKCNRNRFV